MPAQPLPLAKTPAQGSAAFPGEAVGGGLPFAKMHAQGNDFVLVDLIRHAHRLDADEIRAWGDRRRGVGFDQLLTLQAPARPDLDFSTRVFNSDGSESGCCLNGARCLADWVHRLGYCPDAGMALGFADLVAELRRDEGGAWVTCIPLAQVRSLPEPLVAGDEAAGWKADLGNPHILLDLPEASEAGPDALERADLRDCHRRVEASYGGQFPDGFNLSLMLCDGAKVRSRVLERGAGETPSCGSATLAQGLLQLRRLGALDSPHNTPASIEVRMPGGAMQVALEQRGDGGPLVCLRGPSSLVFDGLLPASQA